MNFLIDAHLPWKMVGWLTAVGCNARHTLELPLGNRTLDCDIIERADQETRVLITKDGDFVNSHLLLGQPSKLLLVSTGNISNRQLERLMIPLLPRLVADFQAHAFQELGRSGIIIRG